MFTEVLTEEAWNFVVFRGGSDWIMTYVAGGVGLYEVSICLSEDETARIRAAPAFAKSSVDQFRQDPHDYQARELRPAVPPPGRDRR